MFFEKLWRCFEKMVALFFDRGAFLKGMVAFFERKWLHFFLKNKVVVVWGIFA